MDKTTDTPIRLENVTKVFFSEDLETHALSRVDLTIRRGEYVSIAGPSGGGKTTLLSILGLLDTPTTGEQWLNGTPVAKLSARERASVRNREVGFIFQAFGLLRLRSLLYP